MTTIVKHSERETHLDVNILFFINIIEYNKKREKRILQV